jgi:hypothetical protein
MEDPRLRQRVSNQRVLKRKLDRGEPSLGMTAARVARLDALGFAWARSRPRKLGREAAWEAQLAKLVVYKAAHGDCSVPQGWGEDPRLSLQVGRQPAAGQEGAGPWRAQPRDDGGAGGEAGRARLRVESAQETEQRRETRPSVRGKSPRDSHANTPSAVRFYGSTDPRRCRDAADAAVHAAAARPAAMARARKTVCSLPRLTRSARRRRHARGV